MKRFVYHGPLKERTKPRRKVCHQRGCSAAATFAVESRHPSVVIRRDGTKEHFWRIENVYWCDEHI